ncbi:hypothetical protein [Bacteroides eggerthii]|jgi:hypothetical protein bfra3_13555|uniref:Uncharacterized protein n=1 Tax=Bacteroides eggerthii TaxID=28111 RepID=A0A975KGK9_9BACE|nr:hypothetical protein [Bacteroides eggerthii]QUT45449.1 hypothetical protein INE88_02270 [Bacteroides eggerthii]DAN67237.1 MAG TPA: tail protein [Caudoviricetes sp.]
MELNIYNQSGELKLTASVTSSSTWNLELMRENALSLTFTIPVCVSLQVNDYIILEGVRFSVKKEYKPRKKNSQKYSYSVKFYAPIHDAQQVVYLHLTNGQYEPQFSLDGSPREHLQKWVDNMNRIYGEERWRIGDVIDAPNQNIEYSNTTCWDALASMAEIFSTEWWSDGFYINLCRCERGERVELGYGKGLTSLTPTENSDDVKFFTRLIPLGSTRNIDRSRYGFSRLQLPDRAKYVDRNTDYGLYEHVEEDAFAGIFPHYTGTVSSVRSQEKTGNDGKPFTVYYFKDEGIKFDPCDYEIAGLVKQLSFQSGELNGRDFEANYHSESGEWEIINIYPDEDTQLPGGNLIPHAGDQYIPWNFRMPEAYEKQAELDYKAAVDDFLSSYSEDITKYGGDTDYTYIGKHSVPLQLGQSIRLLSEEYFPGIGYRDTRMTKVTRKLENLSMAAIECTNRVGKGWKRSMESDLNGLQYIVGGLLDRSVIEVLKSWDNRSASEYNVFSALRTIKEITRRAISKIGPDRTSFLVSFLAGAVFGKEGFASGLTGFGAKIDENGNGEMRGLRLWEWLEVPELRLNRVEVYAGIKWRTPGVGIIESVEIDTDSEGKLLSTGTVHLKLEAGEIGAVAADDISMGIIHFDDRTLNATEDSDDSKGNFRFAGFGTAYFRITGVSGQDNGTFRYSLRPGTTLHPQKYMHFSCYGNFTNHDRQTSVYETRTYSRMLRNQNTWEISAANIAMQSGDLSNLNVHGLDMTGYSMYLNSVYFTGTVRQMKPDGTPVYTANDRGAWTPKTEYDFYDRVSHDGSIWLCVNEKGSFSEPSEGNADWLKQVNKGEDGKDGDSVSNHGQWQTGKHIPYLGIVRMGNATWQCTVPAGTDNPPMWTVTDKDGNRLLQTQDGGKTYGYILTGTENSTEYIMIAQDGTDGIPGTPGKDGKVLYTWIRYADDAQGNGISDNPVGKKFLGLAHNKETSVESNDPKDYQWSDIKGEDGIGLPGEDGKTYYTWVAYSDNADGSAMYQQPNENTKYIGIAVNKETAVESTDPTDYTWSKFKGEDGKDGEDGDSVSNHGQWQTGKHIPYLGIVRMGNATWQCTVPAGTDNPPMWTITDKDGNRLLQTQDGGKTYGYILTGELNTAEYELVAQDGTDGESIKGDPGIQGCIIRKGEWKIGVEWRNDESLTSGTRYLDVALVRDGQVATGWKAYKCKTTHTSSLANAPGNSTYWEEFGLNTTAIFTSLIIAKDAQIDFMQGNQLLIKKDDGTVTAGLSGTQSGEKIRMWAGSPTPDDAPFRVTEGGKVHAENAEITGEVNATSGTFKNIKSPNNSFVIKENGDIEITGKVSTSVNGKRIVIDSATNSLRMYGSDDLLVGTMDFIDHDGGTYPRMQLTQYVSGNPRYNVLIRPQLINVSENNGNDFYDVMINTSGITFLKNNVITKSYPNR